MSPDLNGPSCRPPGPPAAAPRGQSPGSAPGPAGSPAHAVTGEHDHEGAPADDVALIVEEDALVVASRERDDYLDMLRRVQADFENYKKRMQRQQTDQLERASENLVAKLLPALDAFDLTRAHLGDGDDASPEVKALLQAASLVDDVLAKEGLERINDAGAPFDPTVHDAVEHAPAPEAGAEGDPPPGQADEVSGPLVADVLRSGYRWKGRVIRPAMVRVPRG